MQHFNKTTSNYKISFIKTSGLIAVLIFSVTMLSAQELQKSADNTAISGPQVKITVDKTTGVINYVFANGMHMDNTVAYVRDLNTGYLSTTDLSNHACTSRQVNDNVGKGLTLV